jgi:hypothetical protein
MQDYWNLQTRRSLEEFLHDLICTAGSPQEVGILVDVLMAMQASELPTAAVTTKAARA